MCEQVRLISSRMDASKSFTNVSNRTTMSQTLIKYEVMKNKGFLAQPLKVIGFEIASIRKMFPPTEDPPEGMS